MARTIPNGPEDGENSFRWTPTKITGWTGLECTFSFKSTAVGLVLSAVTRCLNRLLLNDRWQFTSSLLAWDKKRKKYELFSTESWAGAFLARTNFDFSMPCYSAAWMTIRPSKHKSAESRSPVRQQYGNRVYTTTAEACTSSPKKKREKKTHTTFQCCECKRAKFWSQHFCEADVDRRGRQAAVVKVGRWRWQEGET